MFAFSKSACFFKADLDSSILLCLESDSFCSLSLSAASIASYLEYKACNSDNKAGLSLHFKRSSEEAPNCCNTFKTDIAKTHFYCRL